HGGPVVQHGKQRFAEGVALRQPHLEPASYPTQLRPRGIQELIGQPVNPWRQWAWKLRGSGQLRRGRTGVDAVRCIPKRALIGEQEVEAGIDLGPRLQRCEKLARAGSTAQI